MSKYRLVELVWGEAAPAGAMGTLESYVSVLRRHLQPGQAATGPLKTTNGGYVMDASLVEVDLRHFDSLLGAARCAPPHEAYRLLVDALGIASAPLLENELGYEWAQSQQDVHATRVGQARLLAAEAALELGRAEEAGAHARAVLGQEALEERAWTELVLGLEAAGRAVEGLQAYDRCRRLLGRELGCAPGSALRSAHRRMLEATAGHDDDLARAVSALLVLHGHFHQPPPATGRVPGAPDPRACRKASRAAGLPGAHRQPRLLRTRDPRNHLCPVGAPCRAHSFHPPEEWTP
ncbi:BTAD domain-containing putative transcriptional regulator [Kocuria sp. CPCC 205263]|uniref:AfsR/SARP family transcriptional regulator n=1 Tax=Kocuria sp. CPCC 205263 TaxID=3073555 RepID=UPI0034D71637